MKSTKYNTAELASGIKALIMLNESQMDPDSLGALVEASVVLETDTSITHSDIKKCTKCGQFKPATTEYFRERWDRRSADGLTYPCKKCLNKRRTNQKRLAKFRDSMPVEDLQEIQRLREQSGLEPLKIPQRKSALAGSVNIMDKVAEQIQGGLGRG